MDDDSQKKVGDITEENAPADLDKVFETGDDDPVTPPVVETPSESTDVPEASIAPPTEEPGSDVSPLATPEVPTSPKPFQDVAPTPTTDVPKSQDIKIEVSNAFSDPKDKKGKSTAQASNVPVFPNADMGAGTVNVFPKKTSAVPAVLATVFAILFVLALAALAWVLYANNWNYLPKKSDNTTQTTTKTTDTAQSEPANTTATDALRVTELGVQLTNLPDTLKDLTYTAKTNADNSVSATLTTPEIKTAVSADSGADPSTCAVGMLNKETGTYSNQQLMDQTFVAQFNGFYLTFAGEQGNCSSTSATNAVVTDAQNAFTSYLKNTDNIVAL